VQNAVVKRYRGHQNISKNFIRAMFGPSPLIVTGGSEVRRSAHVLRAWGVAANVAKGAMTLSVTTTANVATILVSVAVTGTLTVTESRVQNGLVYTWDRATGEATQTLGGHSGAVFQTAWNSNRDLLARYLTPGRVIKAEAENSGGGLSLTLPAHTAVAPTTKRSGCGAIPCRTSRKRARRERVGGGA
jgi:hypothetical protein